MLHFFPEPYEDEVFYSVIARYFYYSGSTSFYMTHSLLFDGVTACPIYLPKSLDALTDKMPVSTLFDNDYFIDYTSIFPLYRPFISTVKANEVEAEMKGSQGHPYAKLGLARNNEKEYPALYYCPLCSMEDINNHKEPYFHRTHQASGVILCHIHGCMLEKYPCVNRDLSRGKLICADENKMLKVPRYEYDEVLNNELMNLAISVYKLLTTDSKAFNIDVTVRLYQRQLDKLGYYMGHGYIRKKSFMDAFYSYFSLKLMILLNVNKNSCSWFDRIFLNPDGKYRAALNPTRHILVILFLFGTIDNFLALYTQEILEQQTKKTKYELPDNSATELFGDGPWPCLNPIAEHYGSHVINSYTLSKKNKSHKLIGYFECACGYTYFAEPVNNPDKSLKKYKVKLYGHLWNKTLSDHVLMDEIYDIYELSRLMKCNVSSIVTNSRKLGLLDKINIPESYIIYSTESKNIRGRRIAFHRSVVESLLETVNFVTKELIFNEYHSTYAYLNKHDRQWLDEHTNKYNYWTEKRKSIDWDKIDDEIVDKLNKAYENLMNTSKPDRVTNTKLTEAIGRRNYILTNYVQLPKTHAFINSHVETKEQFQIRQIRVACEKLTENNQIINKENIINQIGYSYDYFRHRSDSVKSYLESQVKQYKESHSLI